MLINRRQAFISLGLTACSGVAWSFPNLLLPASWKGTYPSAPETFPDTPSLDTTVEDRLRKDLARLAPRVYSEEGIPVFLACMNLVPDKTLHAPAKVSLTPLSAALASAFHRNTVAFQSLHPDAKARDIAPIIEVLADRDFSTGETKEE